MSHAGIIVENTRTEAAAPANAPPLRVLLAAFSARYALGQLLDELFAGLSHHIECRGLVPTNYTGAIPEQALLRIPCGVSKLGGVIASLNPVAHWKVAAAVLRARPDIVHIVTGEGYLWAVTLALVARLARVPIVITLHDPDPHPGNVFERLNAVVRRPVLALADMLHVFSSVHGERALQICPGARLVVIGHGSLAGQFLRCRRAGVAREQLVAFFGRIQHYKGIDILLRAFSMLPTTTRLAIAGPGSLDPEARQLVSALGDRVEVNELYLKESEVAALMQRARVVALPYRHATQSSVPAIAAAFGCRVVASALGNFVDEVPRLGGLLVKPEDPEALAAALLTALASPEPGVVTSPTFNDLARDFVDMYRSSRKLGAYVHVTS